MKYIFSSLLFFVVGILYAQEPRVWTYDHNADLPGATYQFSFVHVSDIHIGEGDPDDDYGTFGFLDTIGSGDIGDPAMKLRSCVTWINANYASKGIRFVIVSGDLTDSGEKSEFYKVKEILDDLEIPYVPLIGNHDVWPYIKGDSAREAPYPYGDSILNEIFSGVFDSLGMFFDNWDNGTRLTRGWNAEGNTTTYLQNYVATYQKNHFVFLDFDPRYHAVFPPGPGIGPEAQLHDYAGGTLLWLRSTLESLPDKGVKNIFLISHHPPAKEFYAFINAFSADELIRIVDELRPFRQHLGIWFAGHIHRNSQYSLAAGAGIPLMLCLEVESNKEQPYGALRLVNVFGSDFATPVEEVVKDVVGIFPNPGTGTVRLVLPNSMKGKAEMLVYAVDGSVMSKREVLLGGSDIFIDIQKWAVGTYVVKLIHEGTIYTAPLVVN